MNLFRTMVMRSVDPICHWIGTNFSSMRMTSQTRVLSMPGKSTYISLQPSFTNIKNHIMNHSSPEMVTHTSQCKKMFDVKSFPQSSFLLGSVSPRAPGRAWGERDCEFGRNENIFDLFYDFTSGVNSDRIFQSFKEHVFKSKTNHIFFIAFKHIFRERQRCHPFVICTLHFVFCIPGLGVFVWHILGAGQRFHHWMSSCQVPLPTHHFHHHHHHHHFHHHPHHRRHHQQLWIIGILLITPLICISTWLFHQ